MRSLRHSLLERERPGADRVQAEVLPCRLRRLRRHDHPGPVRELRQEGRGRRLQHDADRERIHDLHPVHRAQLAAAEAALHRDVALQGVLHRGGVEVGAIMELHAGAQMDQQRGRVRLLVAGGELGHDLQLLVDVEQLVAQPGEHDAADIGAGQGGVEDVGVLAQRDPQGLRGGSLGQQGDTGGCQKESSHRGAPNRHTPATLTGPACTRKRVVARRGGTDTDDASCEHTRSPPSPRTASGRRW